MKNKDTKIEHILQNSFEDYSLPEFKNSWGEIRTNFLKKKLLQFSFNSFNSFNIYTGIILSVMVIIPTILFVSSQDANSSQPQIQLIMSDTVYLINDFAEKNEDTKPVSQQNVSTVSLTKEFSDNSIYENNTVFNTNTTRENVEHETPKGDFEPTLQVVEPVDSSKNNVSNTDTASQVPKSTKKKVIVIQKPPVIVYDTVVKNVNQ